MTQPKINGVFNSRAKFLLAFFRRFHISPVQITFAFSILIGIVAGLGAYVFKTLIFWVEELCHLNNPASCGHLGIWLILIPALGGAIVGPLIYFFAREAKGHGVPEVMFAVMKKGGRIRPIVAIIKSIASAITIGTGGSAGSEGPIVQIGAGFGSTLGQIFHMPPRRIKTFVACGAAGGISAIFNAPFGGIMFSLEVILGEFRGLSFIYVAIASVVSSLISRALAGNQRVFEIPTVLSRTFSWEIISFLLLGVFIAFISKLFNFVLESFEDIYDRIKIPEYLKAPTGGLGVGLLAYFAIRLIPVSGLNNPLSVLGVGYHSISQVMNSQLYHQALLPLIFSLLLLAALKILATSFTLGSGGSGGIFAPSLFIGAMAGGFYGIVLHSIFPHHVSSPAIYALVGMGACFAGAAHAPITAIFILFEMTDSYEIILPIIGAVVVSSLVAHWIKPESIYTEKLKRKGVDISGKKKVDILQTMIIRDVMIRNVQTIPEGMPIKELLELAGGKLHTSLPVTDREGILTGIITYKELRRGIFSVEAQERQKVKDFMNIEPVVAYPDESVDQVFRKMKESSLGFAPVVKSRDLRRVVGIVTYGNIFDAYEKALLD